MTAPAVEIAPQLGLDGKVAFRLFNLTADIPGHPAGSTVSDTTLRKAGFVIPEKDGR